MASKESYTPKKRRIRPSNQTLRQQTQEAKAEAAKPKAAKKRQPVFAKLFAPLKFLAPPLRWTARHLLPKFIREAFGELHSVTWPGRKQSRQLTTAVILFAIVFGALVSVLDLGLDKIFKKVFLHE